MTTYRDAGVDLELGNEASKILYNAAKLTWKNRKGRLGEMVELSPNFSGLRAIDVGGLPPGTFTNLGFDGIGTKIEVAERIGKHDTVAYDLFAMVIEDTDRFGAEAVMLGSILDVNSLHGNIDAIRQLAVGYVNAAEEADVCVVNGEIAELGARIRGYGKKFNYNWGAGVAWFANRERIITGEKIRKGDYLVGLKEDGFRSNGFSLVRKVLASEHGRHWHKEEWENGKTLGEVVLTPSRIYTRAVVEMFGGWNLNRPAKAEIHGIAHITGGGIPEKLGRVLEISGLGADIYDPFEPPRIMDYVKRIGKVSDEEAYRTWNMGQGKIIATPEPEKVMGTAKEYGIESKVIGEIIEKPTIMIKTKGGSSSRKYIYFKLAA